MISNVLPGDEKDLLLRLRDGDQAAFTMIYDRYAGLLESRLRRLVKIDSIVEEIHQDVFMRFWNRREHLQTDTCINAYLFTIALNLTINFYRKLARDKELEKQMILELQPSYDHIEEMVQSKENRRVLENLISLLPKQRQRVYRMVRLEGKSYQEAADYFGLSLSTIKDHMAKSSDFLKNYISTHPHITFVFAAYLLLPQ